MKEIGKKISNTEMVLKPGQTVPNTMANTSTAKNTVREDSLGLIAVRTLDHLRRIIYRARVPTTGQMVDSLWAHGSTIKWKDMELSHGLMVVSTKVITLMTRKRDKVPSSGQMEENMTVAGKMESNMELVITHQPAER